MKKLIINDDEEEVEFGACTIDSRYTFITVRATDNYIVLLPTDLLKVRDWINERVRELQFQGHLADHLGD